MSYLPPCLHVLINDTRWKLSKKLASSLLAKAAEVLQCDFGLQEVTIVLSNDLEVQNLNKTFRYIDAPTNVLSFPSGENDFLGDIILAYETVMNEAHLNKVPPLHHSLHLITHGFLHLLGYDHKKEEEALHMEGLEIQILTKLNIPNPYEER